MTKNFDYQMFLKACETRAKELHLGRSETDNIAQLFVAMRQNQFEGPNAEANRNEYRSLVQRARDGDALAKAEVTSIRVTRTNNFIRAKSNVMSFFETETLGPAEIPYIENHSMGEITVSYIGQDGQARLTQGVKYQQQTQIELTIVSSGDFEYTLKDMFRGTVADENKALVDIAWDIDRKIEKLTWPFLQAQIGAFNLSGAKAGQTWVAHSAINVNNLPTSNLLVIPGNTPTSPFRKECFDAILAYCASFGDSLPDGQGQINPVAIYIPSSESMGWLPQVTLTTFGNFVTEQIFQTGYLFDYGGRKWVIIPDVTLDPNLGLAYVRTTVPVGIFFEKPFMDDVIEDNSTALRKQNKARMSMSKCVGWGLPSTAKMGVIAVQYHNNRYAGSSSSSSSH